MKRSVIVYDRASRPKAGASTAPPRPIDRFTINEADVDKARSAALRRVAERHDGRTGSVSCLVNGDLSVTLVARRA